MSFLAISVISVFGMAELVNMVQYGPCLLYAALFRATAPRVISLHHGYAVLAIMGYITVSVHSSVL